MKRRRICNCTISLSSMKEEKRFTQRTNAAKLCAMQKARPVQAKDSNGKSIFTSAKLKRPKVCSSEFWEQRGAQISYGNLQDEFHEQVAWRYGLERGEVGSNKKHTTKYQWKKQQQEKELAEKDAALTQATAKIEESGQDAARQKRRYIRGREKIGANTIPRRSCRGKASPTRNGRRSGSNANASV